MAAFPATTASQVRPAPSSSAPSTPVLESLQRATCKKDVRELFQRHDVEAINQAWRQLTPVERASLTLAKVFDGTILPDCSLEDT